MLVGTMVVRLLGFDGDAVGCRTGMQLGLGPGVGDAKVGGLGEVGAGGTGVGGATFGAGAEGVGLGALGLAGLELELGWETWTLALACGIRNGDYSRTRLPEFPGFELALDSSPGAMKMLCARCDRTPPGVSAGVGVGVGEGVHGRECERVCGCERAWLCGETRKCCAHGATEFPPA